MTGRPYNFGPAARPRTGRHRGFTLVEILIVIIILGILASIVVTRVGAATEDTRRTSFASALHTFLRLESAYRADTGTYLEDASSGVCPAGFDQYIHREDWEGLTPIGGVWDSQLNESGVTSALGVHFNGQGVTRDDAYMTQIDALIDDGDLSTGGFRKLESDRYYWCIAE